MMTKSLGTVTVTKSPRIIAISDARYSFVQQFLAGSVIFAKRARSIERRCGTKISQALHTEHNACVVSVIMQCVASVEAELYEIVTYGPGHHLGSNKTDHEAQKFLEPLWEVIDRSRGPVARYDTVLHLLRSTPLEKSGQIYKDMVDIVKLRNLIVHHKSEWRSKLDANAFLSSLKNRKFAHPAFVPAGSMFFPHQLLGSQLAIWVINSTVAFFDEVYQKLGHRSRLNGFRRELKV